MSHHKQGMGQHAIVLGGSLAGLFAARILADFFERVTILERDLLPDGPESRKGTPQARHIHVLLTAGRRVMERIYPGLIQDFISAGAVDYDAIGDLEWMTPAGRALRFPSELRLLGATRDLIEWGVRKRTMAIPHICLRDGVSVCGFEFNREGTRVVGVKLEERSGPLRSSNSLKADLVVDASGRGSRTGPWLEAQGYPATRETVVNGFLGYASRLVKPPVKWNGDWKAFYIQCASPERRRGGVISPVEGGRWIVTLAGGGKDYPPTDEEGFRDFARSLADGRFAEAYEAAEPLTPIVGSRSTENRVRHYEDLSRQPEGLLVTGDAVCAFNPVYGQGMSAAAIAAETLGNSLQQYRRGQMKGLFRHFQKKLSQSNSRPWLLATSEDDRYREAEGRRPGRWQNRTHRYLDRVIALTTRSPTIRRHFVDVMHLLRSPSSLLLPSVVVRVALGCLKTTRLASSPKSGE